MKSIDRYIILTALTTDTLTKPTKSIEPLESDLEATILTAQNLGGRSSRSLLLISQRLADEQDYALIL